MARRRPSRKASTKTKPRRSKRSSKKRAPRWRSSNFLPSIGFPDRRGLSGEGPCQRASATHVEAGHLNNSKRSSGNAGSRLRAGFGQAFERGGYVSPSSISAFARKG